MSGTDETSAGRDWDARIAELGIPITEPLPQGGLYSGVVIDGTVAYTSGIVAVEGPPWKLAYAGSVGDELDVDTAKESAALAMRCTLANLRGALGGSLNRVERLLRLTGYVRCLPSFTNPPAVMDGASQVLVDIFGADLLPVRTAVGVAALPGGASVELDTIVKLRS
jgi:enamine deaminase RidA (YjgF/YER057c/UK114 family)